MDANQFQTMDIKKIERELKKVCKKFDIPLTAVDLILNHVRLYNVSVEDYISGAEKKPWLMLQLQAQIFNQLVAFKLTPPKKSVETPEEPDNLTKIKAKIERR